MKAKSTDNVLILFLAAAVFSSSQARGQLLTPEMVVDLRSVSHARIQPQGNYAAYLLRTPRGADEEPGGAYQELWVISLAQKEARPFVRKPQSVSSPEWTPDGQAITFISRRKEFDAQKQVYLIPLHGGEARPLSHAPRNVLSYALSPDGKKLAYRMADEEPADVKEARKKGFDQVQEDTWSVATRVYVEDLESGAITRVTMGPENVWDFTWSPDSREIIYRASDRPFTDDSYMLTDNYVVSADGGVGKKIWDTDGKLELAHLSPDGKTYAWLGGIDYHDPATGSLFVLGRSGGEPKNLMPDFPGTAESFIWKDAQTILLVVIEDTRKRLYQISLSDGKFQKLLGDSGPIIDELSLAADGKRFVTAANSAVHPDELFAGTLGGAVLQRLTDSNPPLKTMPLGAQETITWLGPDGLRISGVLVKPVGYQAGVRYPLQVQVHGGPESARLDGWNTFYNRPVQMLAQRGVMVLLPNYRGSTGKGVAFSKADHQDLMGKEFEDILAGIDYLDQQGMVDPARVGIGGGSYGGYATAWAATRYSQRFAAAVMFVGISNQISKAGMSDIPMENAASHWNLWLYDHYDLVWDRSPLKHIKNARTPTLILHGLEDKRVPTSQSFEMYRALKYVNVPTELITYPREGHGNRERAHQIDFARRALDWYLHYLTADAAGEASGS